MGNNLQAEGLERKTSGLENRKEQASHNQSCCISVIVPVYQAEVYLPRCMESIQTQTWQEYEIILVDDGSEDGGGALCDSFARQDARIRVVHQKNQGLSAARNTGIAHAKGDWIVFIDADDAVSPHYLEYLYRAAVEQNCMIAQCGFQPFEQQLPGSETWDGTCRIFSGEEMQERIYSSDRQVYLESTVSWNKLYRRELFETISFPVGKIHEDEAVSYRLYEAAGQIAVLPCQLYWYYQNPSGIMGRKMNIHRLDYVEILYDRYWFYRQRQQKKLAAQTGKLLYTVLVDMASLGRGEVEDYIAFRHRLQMLCRRCQKPCLWESKYRKERVRIWLSQLNLRFLTMRAPGACYRQKAVRMVR